MADTEMERDETLQMEEAGPSTGEQRKAEDELVLIVDPDDPSVEIGSSKKPKIELNATWKANCLLFITQAFFHFFLYMKLRVSYFYNISIANQVLNAVFACYTILRQDSNEVGQETKNKAAKTGFTVTNGNLKYMIGYEKGIEIIKRIASEQKLVYKSFSHNDKENWYGIVGPYFVFMLKDSNN